VIYPEPTPAFIKRAWPQSRRERNSSRQRAASGRFKQISFAPLKSSDAAPQPLTPPFARHEQKNATSTHDHAQIKSSASTPQLGG
jgi:hypothetical protein